MQDAEQLQLIRSLKGPPAVILLLLMVRGASMTNVEICRFTGYSDKPVRSALETLEVLGFVQNNGHFNGWSLAAGEWQLPLPTMAASGELSASAESGPAHIIRATDRARDPGPEPTSGCSSPSAVKLSTGKIGNIPILTVEDRKYSDLDGEDRKYSDLQPASGSAAADLRSSLKISDQQQQQRGGQDRKNSDLQRLVIHNGIRAPARALVLAAEPTAALAWWWAAELDRSELANPLGWFIQRIKGSEPAPLDLAPIAAAWLALPAVERRELLELESRRDTEAFWFEHGLGPSSAELAHAVLVAGGFDYGEW